MHVAGRGQRELAHVIVEVDLDLLGPERVVEVEGDGHEPPAERREQVHPLADHPLEVVERDRAAGRRRRIVDRDAADVAMRALVLQRQELRVEARELTHVREPSPHGAARVAVDY